MLIHKDYVEISSDLFAEYIRSIKESSQAYKTISILGAQSAPNFMVRHAQELDQVRQSLHELILSTANTTRVDKVFSRALALLCEEFIKNNTTE